MIKSYNNNLLVSLKFLMGILIFLPFTIFSQISYSTDCGTTTGWSFVNLSKTYYASAGCSGGDNNYSFADNLWYYTGDGSMSRTFSGSNGNEVTLTFDFSAHDYSSSDATSTSEYDVYLQYSTDNSSWSTVATMSKSSSSSCQSKVLTHTPTSGTIYYKILVDWISGDFDVEIDNISFTQASGPSISYSSATYCSSGSDPSPTLTGNAGSGTYSSSVGLSINTSTGVIDLSASTGGTYTVTYTDTDSQTATFDVTISADTYYVKPAASGGSDSNNGLTSGTAFATLQKAINMVGCSSTTINIAAGTYTEDGIEIPDGTSNLTITGAGMGSTIFDGTQSDRFILLNNSGDSDNTSNTDNITISDMKILEYRSTDPGGAIKIEENITNITFQDIWFHNCNSTNTSNYEGGGAIFLEQGSDLTITSCKFSTNDGYYGGAIHSYGESSNNNTLEIYKSTFYDNSANTYYGGAIQTDYTTLTLNNNLFYENSCDESGTVTGYGGAISSYYGTTTAFNNTFADNVANNYGGGIRINYGTHTYTNCIFYNNTASSYPNTYEASGTLNLNYCINSGSTSGVTETNDYNGNDPGFVDAANDDYSINSSSYSVDKGLSTGAPSDDINGTTRSGNPDLGCYESVPNEWTGAVSNIWTNSGNWSLGSVPSSSDEITIPNVSTQPEISSTVSLTGLTIDSGADITVSSNSLTVTGTFDLNGTMNIDNATVNADGTFDATSGTIDFTNANGKLILSSTVTSLGTLDALMGTVEYDGATQTVFGDNYYNLEIDVSGTKSAGGAINVDGSLSTAATAGCKLDMGAYALNVAGNLSVGATNGLDLSDASSLLNIDGSSDQTLTHAGSTGAPASLLTENFSSGSIAEGNSSTYVSQNASGNTSHSGSNGYWKQSTSDTHDNASCSGCSSYRATIESGSGAGSVATLWVGSFTPASSSVDISFNWSFSDRTLSSDANDYFKVYLDPTSGSDIVLVNYTGSGDMAGQSYSASSSVTAGVEYVFTVKYANANYSYGIYGASIDNISVTQAPTSGFDVNDLTINNSGGNVIFNDEISVDGTITFTSGDIDASSNNLVLTSNASVSGADDDSHVVGTIVKTIASDASHEFPLGNGSVLRKVDIDPNDATSRDWTVTYTDNVYSDVTTTGLLTYVSDACYWDISPTSTPASTTVKLNWSSAIGINDADLTNIKLAHYNGTDWELISTTTSGVPLAGSVSGNVTSFSPFTIGTTGANPLPVTLTQFEGYAYNEFDNKLEWTTKTEKNADYMEIQHSDDGIYFDVIGIEKLAGNSINELFYEYIDRSVSKKINYYRLKQFDFDGKSTLTKTISIDNRSSDAKKILRITNLIGQEIDKNYKGVVIIQYSDGSSEKRIQ